MKLTNGEEHEVVFQVGVALRWPDASAVDHVQLLRDLYWKKRGNYSIPTFRRSERADEVLKICGQVAASLARTVMLVCRNRPLVVRPNSLVVSVFT